MGCPGAWQAFCAKIDPFWHPCEISLFSFSQRHREDDLLTEPVNGFGHCTPTDVAAKMHRELPSQCIYDALAFKTCYSGSLVLARSPPIAQFLANQVLFRWITV